MKGHQTLNDSDARPTPAAIVSSVSRLDGGVPPGVRDGRALAAVLGVAGEVDKGSALRARGYALWPAYSTAAFITTVMYRGPARVRDGRCREGVED
jgi:hypothetical protein